VSAERPKTIVERNVGAGGRRVANGTYILQPLPSGGTRIVFEYAWQQAPLSERLASPLVRTVLRRGNQRAMERLAERLGDRVASPGR
jgi:carbon monoxide dehydrogenase subunit G